MEYFYKGIRYVPPSDTTGLLAKRPDSAQKCPISESALASLVLRGAMAMTPPAHHRTIFAAHVQPNVREGMSAEMERLRAQGETHRRLPDRGYFTGKKSFKRGDRVFHSAAGHQKGTVLGPSSSRQGFLKVSINGRVFRVHPDNLRPVE